MKKLVLVVMVALFTFSCSNEPKKESIPVEVEKAIETKKEFIVKMSFRTNKSDSFSLMLNNIEIDEFQTKDINIKEEVSQASKFELITANFGESISESFRINIGNKEAKDVEIDFIKISYGEKKLEISSRELGNYFSFNEFVNYDTINSKFETRRIDGKHYPFLILKKEFMISLAKN